MPGDDLLYLTVHELGERIRSGAVSPVELTQQYLQRSRTLGARLNAYATLTEDLALKQARAAEAEVRAGRYRGPLHGIPYAAKDLLAVAGYPTTWGAKPYANQQFDYDATVIRKLRDAGAVLLGKAAMIELAGGMGYRYASASLTGAARNPWNATCWTCGSSSGSGAIVAAGLAAFAIGTETWGSIICPAAFCGISGLRPTYGRVSRHGAMALSYSMDKIGPMARSAEDCELVLAAIAGYDAPDPASQPTFGYPEPAVPRRVSLRIGLLSNQWKEVAPDVAAPVGHALQILEKAGATVEEARLPDGPWEAAANVIISVEGASAFDSLIASGGAQQLADPSGKLGGYVAQQISGADFVRAMRLRAMLQQKVNDIFQRFDVLASASLPLTATPLEANLEDTLDFPDPVGAIGNLCGLPAMSVPCGFSEKKLPVGLQFIGPVRSEAAVLAAAINFQRQTDWHRQPPPV
jgi:aspartyl-tRNA(Asn)/glutamyl-tRNA(Gln) amidotransferase subunit A